MTVEASPDGREGDVQLEFVWACASPGSSVDIVPERSDPKLLMMAIQDLVYGVPQKVHDDSATKVSGLCRRGWGVHRRSLLHDGYG